MCRYSRYASSGQTASINLIIMQEECCKPSAKLSLFNIIEIHFERLFLFFFGWKRICNRNVGDVEPRD